MARRSTSPSASTKAQSPPRKRRTAAEARSSILDAAERLLVERGPAGIRLQDVADDVGVSHPTVLHHFGSREGLVEAVVARALDSLHAGLLAAVRASPEGSDQVVALLDAVFRTMATGGHARAVLWLALAGYEHTVDHLHTRSLAEAVHEVRLTRRKEQRHAGQTTQKRAPPFEDTYFTVLLPAFALLSMAVLGQKEGEPPRAADDAFDAKRFRAWLARLIHKHLEEG